MGGVTTGISWRPLHISTDRQAIDNQNDEVEFSAFSAMQKQIAAFEK
jgi:hypothetical protein